jgi:protein-tyrosine phosphatase
VTGNSYRILFVCTGNICRSPFAQLLTQYLLAQWLPPEDAALFSVGSAGTRAIVGAGMDPLTYGELGRWGLRDVAGDRHFARQLDRAAVASADLVLTAERAHRSHVVALHPPALRTTFCLREFSRLVTSVTMDSARHDPVRRMRVAVAAAALERGMTPPVGTADDSVPDPVGQPPEAHNHSTALIGAAVCSMVKVFLGDMGHALDTRPLERS